MLSKISHHLFRPLYFYNAQLEKRPLLTKSLTSGMMYAGGDIIAQLGENYHDTKSFSWKISKKRTLIFFIFGTFVAGPSYHYWFNYLNELPAMVWQLKQSNHRWRLLRAYAILKSHGVEVKLDMAKIPKAAKLGKWTNKVIKIAADQLVFSSTYTMIFFVLIGGMTHTIEKIENDTKVDMDKITWNEFIILIQDCISKTMEITGNSSNDRDDDDIINDVNTQHINDSIDITSNLFNDHDKIERNKLNKVIYHNTNDDDNHDHDDDGYTWNDVWNKTYKDLNDVYWTTYLTDCLIWPPLQLVNFTLIPLKLQFLYVNVANLGWNTFLSVMANRSTNDTDIDKIEENDINKNIIKS